MDKADALSLLQREITGCRLCPRLVTWREQVGTERRRAFRDEQYWGRPLPGFGDQNARLVVVGLAPAAHGGNRTGRMFTGDRSGDWLFRALCRSGYANQPNSVSRDDGLVLRSAYVSAVVKCPPPANKPLPQERDNCIGYLRRELDLLQRARVLVALGQFAFLNLARIYRVPHTRAFAHGAQIAINDSLTLICSYHPSQQNTFTGKLTESMFDSVFERARELTG